MTPALACQFKQPIGVTGWCVECLEFFKLIVGRTLVAWQNASGQIVDVECQCPRCRRKVSLPKAGVQQF
jgi:hypothetical protein